MARGPAPVELVVDCPSCGLEAGVVEVYDALVPACRFGVPATSRCKLCGDAHEGRFDRPPPMPMRDIAANRCPGCLLELSPSAVDDRRCAGCGATAVVVRVAEPRVFLRERDLAEALAEWAAREGQSVQELVDATFCERSVAVLFERLDRGERLEVVADPFGMRPARMTAGEPPRSKKRAADVEPSVRAEPRGASDFDAARPDARGASDFAAARPEPPRSEDARGASDFDAARPEPPRSAETRRPSDFAAAAARPLETRGASDFDAARPEPPRSAETRRPSDFAAAAAVQPEAPRSAPPRAIVYPLVSLIVADGEIHEAERELVDRFLKAEGMPPLTDAELRIHHPSEVAHLVPKDRREGVVQLMCEAASVDGMPDESERRVIRAYAAAWDVPDEKVDFWMWGYESMGTSLARQLWLKIRRFVLSARWSDEAKDLR